MRQDLQMILSTHVISVELALVLLNELKNHNNSMPGKNRQSQQTRNVVGRVVWNLTANITVMFGKARRVVGIL